MIHRFGSFEVDDERFELRHGSHAVRMEPRVLEVLVFLVQNRGRVVTKEELIDCVWKKKFVSESALTRCVAEARRILIATAPREDGYVKTVHGRGYRFEVDGDTPVTPPPPAPPPSRRFSLWFLGVPLLLLSTVGAIVGFRDAGERPLRIALLPVSVQDDDAEMRLIALTMNDLLLRRLEITDRVIVRPPDYNTLVEADSLASYAVKVRADHVVSATLRRGAGGSKAQVTATLHEIRSGTDVRDTPLGRYDIPLPGTSRAMAQFAATRDRIVSRLVERLLPAVRMPSPTGITPRDSQAYRLYLLASDRLVASGCNGDAPVELLRRSLEIDPQFEPAWSTLGWAHYEVASSCGGLSENYNRALIAADRALSLRPTATDAIALKARVLTATGRLEEAFLLLRRAIAAAPSNPDLQALVAQVLTYSGEVTEAERWLDSLLKVDPDYLTSRGLAPAAYFYSGQTEKFLHFLPATDTPLFRYYRGLAEVKAGRTEQAREALRPAFRLNPSDISARLSQALLAILERQPEEAREMLHQVVRERRETGARDGETTYRIAQLLVMAGDRDEGLEHLTRAIAEGFFCSSCIQNDPLIASLRSDPRFREGVDRSRQRQSAFRSRFAGEAILSASR